MRGRVPGEIQGAGGRPRPASAPGNALARTARQLQRTVGNRAASRLLARAEVAPFLNFSVKVSRPMSSRELLVAFAVQTRKAEHLTDEQAAQGIADGEIYWVDGSGGRIELSDPAAPKVSADEAKQGYKLITVYAAGITPMGDAALERSRTEFYALGAADEDAINTQTNELFWQLTGYKVGQKLDPEHDENDRLLAQDWLRIRAHVVAQRRQYLAAPPDLKRVLYEMIPPASRPFMFGPGGEGELHPTDFGMALDIAHRIAELTPQEREEYWARVQGTTTSWSAYRNALDSFVAERERRGEAAATRELAAGALEGCDDLYFAFMAYEDAFDHWVVTDGVVAEMVAAQVALETVMERYDFPSIDDVRDFLEPRIDRFRRAFEQEAMLLADELLDRFRHLLWSELERLVDGNEMRAFHDAIKGAGGNLESLVDDWPLLRDEDLRARLKGVGDSPGYSFNRVRSYAKQRRESISDAEQELHADRELIYAFDVLRETALQSIGAAPGSMQHDMVMRRKREIDDAKFVKSIFLTVIAIVAGILSRGGTIGLIATGAAVGIGTWETLEEFREYEVGVKGHEAGLLSDSPSKFWVILSAMGALGDAAAAVKVLSGLGEAVEGIDTAADVARLEEAYDDVVARALADGDVDGAKALADARYTIVSAAKRRVKRTLDEEIDDAFEEVDELLTKPAIELKLAGDLPRVRPTYGPIEEVELSWGQVELEFRIPVMNQARFQHFADAKGIEIFVRPTNKQAIVHIITDTHLMKPADIKAKSINELDVFLGAPRSAIGDVGYFKPKPPVRPKEGMTDDEWNDIVERFAQRDEEFWTESRKMSELQKPKGTQIGTENANRVRLDEGGVMTDVESGKTFTGDHDMYEIRRADGTALTKAEYDDIVAEMRKDGVVQHGAHLRWEPTPNEQSIYDRIVKTHESGEEALVRFRPREPPRRAAAPKRQ